jgi:hypothetical protein
MCVRHMSSALPNAQYYHSATIPINATELQVMQHNVCNAHQFLGQQGFNTLQLSKIPRGVLNC